MHETVQCSLASLVMWFKTRELTMGPVRTLGSMAARGSAIVVALVSAARKRTRSIMSSHTIANNEEEKKIERASGK